MPKDTSKAKKSPVEPYDLKSQEEFAKNYWGLAYDRHGIFSKPTIDVTWDNISEPLSAFGWDMANGYLTSDSIPSVLDGKIFWGMNGSELNPSFSFTNEINTGWWLGQSPSSLNASVLGSWKVAIQDADFTHFNRLVFNPTNTHDIGGDGTIIPGDNQVLCPRNILAGNHFYLYSYSIFWNRIVGVSTSNQTHTLQDNTGTIYETGGLDVAIADGGTNASTASAGFDNLAPTTTAGDIIVRNDAGTTNIRLAAGDSGQVLTSNGVAEPSWEDLPPPGTEVFTKVKAADETRTSTITPTDDAHLFIDSVINNKTYVGKLIIFYGISSPSAGFSLKINFPTGGTPTYPDFRAGVISGEGVVILGADSVSTWTDSAVVLTFGTTSSSDKTIEIAFALTTTDDASGTINMQWSQTVSTATPNTFYRGSSLSYTALD